MRLLHKVPKHKRIIHAIYNYIVSAYGVIVIRLKRWLDR